MHCAEVDGQDVPLRVVTRELPTTPPAGLLVKTSFAGVCHTDVHFIKDPHGGWVGPRRDLLKTMNKYIGLVPGHETAGVVEQLGSAVASSCPIKVGDKVMVYPWRGCTECPACLGGETNACEDNLLGTVEIGQGPNPGGYSTHVPLPKWELAVKVPDNIPMDVAAMLPCGALTAWVALDKAVAAIERGIRLRQKANLLVIGAGGLGTWCVNLAKMRFQNQAVRIICADISEGRLRNASEVGADEVVVWKPDATVETLVSETTAASGKMDAALDFVGADNTAQVGLASLYKGSTLVFVGIFGGSVVSPIPALVGKSINIQGTRTGTLSEFKAMVDFLSTQVVKCPAVEYYTIDDVNIAVDKLHEGKINGRALFKFA